MHSALRITYLLLMSSSFLRFQDVSFTYQTVIEPLFEDVSIHAAPGWSGIIGPNGTGKTTFLKLATGLLEPDEGHINAPPLWSCTVRNAPTRCPPHWSI